MLKPYPDRFLGAFARIVADLVTIAWIAAWALAGLAVYQTVMALETIADGISATGHTFNSWIAAIRGATPRGIPYISDYLINEANALQRASGDQLLVLGRQVHNDIFQTAVVLGLMVALPPIIIVAVAYGSWRYRDMREMGAAMQFVRIAYLTGRAEQARAVLAYRAISTLTFRQLMRASSDPVGDLAHHQYDRLAAAMLERAGLSSLRLPPEGLRQLESHPGGEAKSAGRGPA